MTNQRYIPNIRNPQIIETVYQLLTQEPRTEDDIKDVTGLDGSLLDESLDGLLVYGLATQREFKYHAEDLAYDIAPRLDLQLTMLQNVRQASLGDNWDIQAAVFLTYAFFLEKGLQYFQHSDAALATQIDEYHQNKGFRSDDDDKGPSKFQTDKLNNWTKHATLLGLTHKARGSEFTVAPEPKLVSATVQLAVQEYPAGEGAVYVEDYIDWLNENLLLVPFSDRQVPKSIGRVLYSLARDDDLKLVRIGDPATVSMNYVPRDHENVNRRINAIQVTQDGN